MQLLTLTFLFCLLQHGAFSQAKEILNEQIVGSWGRIDPLVEQPGNATFVRLSSDLYKDYNYFTEGIYFSKDSTCSFFHLKLCGNDYTPERPGTWSLNGANREYVLCLKETKLRMRKYEIVHFSENKIILRPIETQVLVGEN